MAFEPTLCEITYDQDLSLKDDIYTPYRVRSFASYGFGDRIFGPKFEKQHGTHQTNETKSGRCSAPSYFHYLRNYYLEQASHQDRYGGSTQSPSLPSRSATTFAVYVPLTVDEGDRYGRERPVSLPARQRYVSPAGKEKGKTTRDEKLQRLVWMDALNAWVPENKPSQGKPYLSFVNTPPRKEKHFPSVDRQNLQKKHPVRKPPEVTSRKLNRKAYSTPLSKAESRGNHYVHFIPSRPLSPDDSFYEIPREIKSGWITPESLKEQETLPEIETDKEGSLHQIELLVPAPEVNVARDKESLSDQTDQSDSSGPLEVQEEPVRQVTPIPPRAWIPSPPCCSLPRIWSALPTVPEETFLNEEPFILEESCSIEEHYFVEQHFEFKEPSFSAKLVSTDRAPSRQSPIELEVDDVVVPVLTVPTICIEYVGEENMCHPVPLPQILLEDIISAAEETPKVPYRLNKLSKEDKKPEESQKKEIHKEAVKHVKKPAPRSNRNNLAKPALKPVERSTEGKAVEAVKKRVVIQPLPAAAASAPSPPPPAKPLPAEPVKAFVQSPKKTSPYKMPVKLSRTIPKSSPTKGSKFPEQKTKQQKPTKVKKPKVIKESKMKAKESKEHSADKGDGAIEKIVLVTEPSLTASPPLPLRNDVKDTSLDATRDSTEIEEFDSTQKKRSPIKKRERVSNHRLCKTEDVVPQSLVPDFQVKKSASWIFNDDDDSDDSTQIDIQEKKAKEIALPTVEAPSLPSNSIKSKTNRQTKTLQAYRKPLETKKSWGPRMRDTSYEDMLRKQELAEARRKRHAEMLARMGHKGFQQDMEKDGITGILHFEDYGFLAKYCIFSRSSLEMYRMAFTAVDENKRGWLNGIETMIALRGTNNKLTDTEEEYIYRIMELTGYNISEGTDFKLFSVLAALSQRITALDNWMKYLIGKVDFKALEMKMFMCKTLWECNVDSNTNRISIDQLMVELRAGGISFEHECEVREKLGHLQSLDLLDFLTYIPLFIMIHESVVDNPLDNSRDK